MLKFSYSPENIYISKVTVAELEYGNYCGGRYEEKTALKKYYILLGQVLYNKSQSIIYYLGKYL